MTAIDPRAWLAELTDHLTDMADSLDDHVTHEDVHRLLMEARQLSLQRDAALTDVLNIADEWEAAYREDRTGSGQRIADDLRTAITDALCGDRE